MPFRACAVSFLYRGQRHTAKVEAETAYEAAALALKAFNHIRSVKGPTKNTVLELEVEAPMRLQLKVSDVLEWLYDKPGKTPKERERKKRLRDLLADDRH